MEEHVLAASGLNEPEALVRFPLDRTLCHLIHFLKKVLRRYLRWGLIRRKWSLTGSTSQSKHDRSDAAREERKHDGKSPERPD